jgi:type I restriction enzyme M protein
MTSILNELLRSSAHGMSQFSQEAIDDLEARVEIRNKSTRPTPYVICRIRNRAVKLTPEEVVRQLYLGVLIDDLAYPEDRIRVEHPVHFGREVKRADICVLDKDDPSAEYIIVEVKKPNLKDGKEQLRSYSNATGAPVGIWSNGVSISYYHRKDPNYFEDLIAIPTATQRLSDILAERWTIADLVSKDKLVKERKSLKGLIEEMEDEVLANAGVDVFEEVFKLIFAKLYDELESTRNKRRTLVFRNYGETETELKAKIQALFEGACDKWEGIFEEGTKLALSPSHLAICVSSLEGVKLLNSNLEVVDEAFEYLVNKSSKGEKGQFFTPRYVIDMCIRMLDPQEHETIIDTAAGSCGFPVHAMFHVWTSIAEDEGIDIDMLTAEALPTRCTDYVEKKVFAIDFDEKVVRVGRTLNLIAGDGQTNVLHLNALDYERWSERTQDEAWVDVYGSGWRRLRRMRARSGQDRDFKFDIVMGNPPFAGDIKEGRILAKYELARKSNGQYATKVGRDVLFLERNMSFLKPGGRMALVLPQGRLNNATDRPIREYISEHGRILAVVGLHGNVFKPHTGTKTSVIFVQKWDGGLCPKVEDYPIFFATMREPSKDTSGEKIYRVGADNQLLLDTHGHLVVKHDLFNHDGLTGDGVAEAFRDFAKREKLSFA